MRRLRYDGLQGIPHLWDPDSRNFAPHSFRLCHIKGDDMTSTPWQARRNLDGNPKIIHVHGDDAKLNKLLDKLEYCAGMEVTARDDDPETEGNGRLTLIVKGRKEQELIGMVKELGLRAGG